MVFIHPEYHIINAEAGANNVNHTNASNYNCISQGIELQETAVMQETKSTGGEPHYLQQG